MRNIGLSVICLAVATVIAFSLFSCNKQTQQSVEQTISERFHLDLKCNYDNAESKEIRDGDETVVLVKIDISPDSFEDVRNQIIENYSELTDSKEFEPESNLLKNLWSEHIHDIDGEFSIIFQRADNGSKKKTVPLDIGVIKKDEKVSLYFGKIE